MRLTNQIKAAAAALIGLSLSPALVQSQGQGAAPQAFDAASIRQSTSKSVRGSEGGPGSKSPTFYRYGQATLSDLICVAWNLSSFQIASSAPLDRDTFDVELRLPDGATREQFRTMLQNLLAERFSLKAHIESRQYPAYELVVAKSGLKIKEAVPGEPPPPAPKAAAGPEWPDLPTSQPTSTARVFFSGGYQVTRLRVQLEPMSILSRMLPREDKLPVVDKTGLTGLYSFPLEYSSGSPAAGSDELAPAPDVFTALEEQLGLELVRGKLPFDTVVVESFNRLPTEN
jgi:uncharacterized protein (TIGR03435 family)